MVPEDVYELRSVSDPRLSPDGRRVAYVVSSVDRERNAYRAAIWLAELDGATPPRQLTAGTKVDAGPRWSPDGSRLAFCSNRDREEPQLYVLPVDGGEPTRLTDLPEEVEPAVWSPDGSRLAFAARVRDAAYDTEKDADRPPRRITRLRYKYDHVGWTADRPKHLFVVAADGGAAPVQVTFGDFEDDGPAWSPDGTRLAFASARHENWDVDVRADIFVVDVASGEDSAEPPVPVRVTPTDGAYSLPSWSPDGSTIAAQFYPGVFDDPRHSQIVAMGADGSDRRVLTASLDRNCVPYPPVREPIWETSERLLFSVEDDGSDHLYRVAADGAAPPDLVRGGAMSLTGYDGAAGRVVHAASTPTAQAELFEGDRQLSSVGAWLAAARAMLAPERLAVVSNDGTPVPAWILRPADFDATRRYPTLLCVHGGPFTQWGGGFFDEFQVYARAGYVVLYANPRGSSGYGEAWGRAIRGPGAEGPGWGSVDYEDLMAVVDHAIDRFAFVDPDRLGVMGGSYGGFMTSWIVGHSDRFRAAVSERALNQWVSMWGSSDIGWDFKGYTGTFMFEDMEAYLRMSPFTYATSITTPLLILHSEEDLRCPVEQAEQLFTTLRLLGRPVEMVRFPGEGHELSRSGSPHHRVMRFEIVLEWLGRHLAYGQAPTAGG